MKHNNTYFAQVSRSIWERNLSQNAIMLYFWLKELEQRYCGEKVDFFFRTNEQLADDLNWSINTLKKAKAELKKETDLIETGRMRWVDRNTGQKSEKYVTYYRLLK